MRQPKGVEILDAVTAQALGSKVYKDELVANPDKVLTAAGLTIPDGVKVKIQQNTAKKIYLVLPTQMLDTIDFDEVDITVIACHTGGT